VRAERRLSNSALPAENQDLVLDQIEPLRDLSHLWIGSLRRRLTGRPVWAAFTGLGVSGLLRARADAPVVGVLWHFYSGRGIGHFGFDSSARTNEKVGVRVDARHFQSRLVRTRSFPETLH